MAVQQIDETAAFAPRFNADGLIPCIAVSARTGRVLMLAYMNAEALRKTIETGEAHYWSRSRGKLWHKGATSGQVQRVREMRIDCDQDTLLIHVEMPEPETVCHTGRASCFYRRVHNGAHGAALVMDEEPL